jgi:hypothetical protein
MKDLFLYSHRCCSAQASQGFSVVQLHEPELFALAEPERLSAPIPVPDFDPDPKLNDNFLGNNAASRIRIWIRNRYRNFSTVGFGINRLGTYRNTTELFETHLHIPWRGLARRQTF